MELIERSLSVHWTKPATSYHHHNHHSAAEQATTNFLQSKCFDLGLTRDWDDCNKQKWSQNIVIQLVIQMLNKAILSVKMLSNNNCIIIRQYHCHETLQTVQSKSNMMIMAFKHTHTSACQFLLFLSQVICIHIISIGNVPNK